MEKIIDTHTHIFSDKVVNCRGHFFHDHSFRILFDADKSRIANAGMLIAMMDQFAVENAFCLSFPWYDEKDSDRENKYIIESAYTSSGRLIPFGSVPRSGRVDIKDYINNLAQEGFFGIGEIGFYDTGFGHDEQRFLETVLDGCEEHDLVAVLHVNESIGHDYKGKYRTDQTDLYNVISGFQDVRIILSHWGGGFFIYEMMPDLKEKFKNVYYDTAASPYIYDQRIFKAAIESAGKEKILFGSDYPLLTPKRYLEQISMLSEDDQSSILFENALRFLK
jgi:uncharacterized protein